MREVFVSVSIPAVGRTPGSRELRYQIAIDELQFMDLYYVPPEPPPFDPITRLVLWQEKLARSNDACTMLGQSIARALREAFQKDAMERK